MPKAYLNNPQVSQDINNYARKYQAMISYYKHQDIMRKQIEMDVFLELKYQQIFQDFPKAYLVVNFLDLYCTIEQAQHPYLRNVPFIIMNDNFVMACNAEARKYNIRPGDSLSSAKQTCKYLKIIDGNDANYYDVCKKLDMILREFDQDYQVLGLDSALLDITTKVFQTQNTQYSYNYYNTYTQNTFNQSQHELIFWNVDNPTAVEYQALQIAYKLKKKLETDAGNISIGISYTPQLAALCTKNLTQQISISKLSFTSHRELQNYSKHCIDSININQILPNIIQEQNENQWGNNQLQNISLNQFLGLCMALNIQSVSDLYDKRGMLYLIDSKGSKRILKAICGLLDSQKVMENTQIQFQSFIFEGKALNKHEEQQNLRIQLLKLCKQICSKLQNGKLLCTMIDIHLVQTENRVWKVSVPVIPNSDQLQDVFAILETLLIQSRRSLPYDLMVTISTSKNIPIDIEQLQNARAGLQITEKKQSGPLMKYILNNQRQNAQVSFADLEISVSLPGVPLGVPTVGSVHTTSSPEDLRQAGSHKQISNTHTTQSRSGELLSTKSMRAERPEPVRKPKHEQK